MLKLKDKHTVMRMHDLAHEPMSVTVNDQKLNPSRYVPHTTNGLASMSQLRPFEEKEYTKSVHASRKQRIVLDAMYIENNHF